ncbi:MAG: 3'-5' exonuclease, partial [Vogesella sp.]
RWAGLPVTGQAHRALADAEMAANLLQYLQATLRQKHGLAQVSHGVLCKLQKVTAAKEPQYLRELTVSA